MSVKFLKSVTDVLPLPKLCLSICKNEKTTKQDKVFNSCTHRDEALREKITAPAN